MNLLEFSSGFLCFSPSKKKTNNRGPLGKSHHGHPRRFPRRICIGRLISGELRVGQEAPGEAASLVWMGFLHPWKNGQNEFFPSKKGDYFQLEKYTSEPTIDFMKTCSGSGEHLWLSVTNHENRVCDCEIADSVYKHVES